MFWPFLALTADADSYNLETLALFFLTYLGLATITSGLALPSGLFIPAMLMGASFGRFIGTGLQLGLPQKEWIEVGRASVGPEEMLATLPTLLFLVV